MSIFKTSLQTLCCDAATVQEYRLCAGLSQAAAAELLGVNVRTLKRWEHGRARIPRAVCLSLALLYGDLGAVMEGWEGWRLRWERRAIVAPNGYTFTQGEMLALPYTYALLAEYQRQDRLPLDTANVRALKPADAATRTGKKAG